eukprot:g1967.t1
MSSSAGIVSTLPERPYYGSTTGREAGSDYRKIEATCLHCKIKLKEKTNRPSRTKSIVVNKATTIKELHEKIYAAFTTEQYQKVHPYGDREVVRIVPYSAGSSCPFPSGELMPYSRDGSIAKKLVVQISNGQHGTRSMEELGLFHKSVNYIYFAFAYKGQSALPLRRLLKLIEKGPGEPLKNECKCHAVFYQDKQSFKRAAKKICGGKVLSKLVQIVDRTPLREKADFAKYAQKMKFLPETAVRACMTMDGLSPQVCDAFFNGDWKVSGDEEKNDQKREIAVQRSRPPTGRPITERTAAMLRNMRENEELL